MINSIHKIDFKSIYIGNVRHLPDGKREDIIFKLTWAGYDNFSYWVLNYSGDNREHDFYYSDDDFFQIYHKICDDGSIQEDLCLAEGFYYFVRVQHQADKKLHNAVIKILNIDGPDFTYEAVSYPFTNKYHLLFDYRFEFVSCLNYAGGYNSRFYYFQGVSLWMKKKKMMQKKLKN